MKTTAVVALLSCALLASCSNSLEQTEYIQWVEDYKNGLHVRRTVNEFDFDLQFQPTPYVGLMKGQPKGDTTVVGLQHYVLKISVNNSSTDIVDYNVQNISDKQQRLYYFSYSFQNDIHLEEKGKTLPCVLFHAEQSDLSTSRTFLLGFEGEASEDGEMSVVVIDSPLFGSLPIKIKISKQNIPSLKL